MTEIYLTQHVWGSFGCWWQKKNFRIHRFSKHKISLELDKFVFAWDIKIKDFKIYILGFQTGDENFQTVFVSDLLN